MSWLQRENTNYVITTGDGVSYTPLWFKSNVIDPFNFTEFNFKGVEKSLVRRGKIKSPRYEVDIVFQGENCLETMDAFRKSSKNPAPWTISHPTYGSIVGNPTELRYDNSKYNVVQITGTVIETIGTKAVNTPVSKAELVQQQVYKTNETINVGFTDSVQAVDISLIQQMTNYVNGMYLSISSDIANEADFTNFTNAYASANRLINNTVFDIAALISQIQYVALAPATFSATAVNRVALAYKQFAALVSPEFLASKELKALYENNAASIVMSMCLASVTQYDYANRVEVIETADTISGTFLTYLTNLSNIQSETGAVTGGYMPNPNSINDLYDAVYLTLSALYEILNESKQQITVTLDERMTLIQAVHKYMGLDTDDKNIQLFININKLNRQELIIIPTGRQITYNA